MPKKNLVEACKHPSDLLLLAIDDLRRAEKSKKKYRVDMDQWHTPNSHCAVCFGGAVMAFSLDLDPEVDGYPNNFNRITSCRISALNTVRLGDCNSFVKEFYEFEISPKVKNKMMDLESSFPVVDYKEDPLLFKKQMKKIAAHLQKHGL
jgi:hypothetical protein